MAGRLPRLFLVAAVVLAPRLGSRSRWRPCRGWAYWSGLPVQVCRRLSWMGLRSSAMSRAKPGAHGR